MTPKEISDSIDYSKLNGFEWKAGYVPPQRAGVSETSCMITEFSHQTGLHPVVVLFHIRQDAIDID